MKKSIVDLAEAITRLRRFIEDRADCVVESNTMKATVTQLVNWKEGTYGQALVAEDSLIRFVSNLSYDTREEREYLAYIATIKEAAEIYLRPVTAEDL